MCTSFRSQGSSRDGEICRLVVVTTVVLGIAAGSAEAQLPCYMNVPSLVLSASAGYQLSIFNRGPQGDCFEAQGPPGSGTAAVASIAGGCDLTYANVSGGTSRLVLDANSEAGAFVSDNPDPTAPRGFGQSGIVSMEGANVDFPTDPSIWAGQTAFVRGSGVAAATFYYRNCDLPAFDLNLYEKISVHHIFSPFGSSALYETVQARFDDGYSVFACNCGLSDGYTLLPDGRLEFFRQTERLRVVHIPANAILPFVIFAQADLDIRPGGTLRANFSGSIDGLHSTKIVGLRATDSFGNPIDLSQFTTEDGWAFGPEGLIPPADSETDTEAPTLTLPSDVVVEATGPLGATVTYEAAASDNVDGTVTPSCTPASGSTFPLGSTTVNCSATDSHLNTATGSFNVSVRDTIPPTIAIGTPTGTRYVLNAIVATSYTCTDGGSGIATCLGSVPSGSAIPMSTIGESAFTVSATDIAGNGALETVRYSVGYKVSPLYDPAKPFKSGSTVPLRLQLVDAAGQNMSSPAVAVMAASVQMIGATVTGTPTDAGNANPDYNFRYDPDLGGSGGYIYNMSTSGLAPGVYAVNFDVTGDTNHHQVQFQIK